MNNDAMECSDTITTCIAGSDSGLDGEAETVVFTPSSSGRHYMIVDSYSVDMGSPYSLTVTSP